MGAIARALTVGCILLVGTSAHGELRSWDIGGGALSWKSQELRSTAVRTTTPGTIQLVNFAATDNIIAQLKWVDGFPVEYIAERTGGLIWDNVAVERPLLTLVDGIDTTSTGEAFKRFGISQVGTRFFLDLGTRFPVSRILFFPRQSGTGSDGRPFKDDFIRGYVLRVNDGVNFNEQKEPIYAPVKVVDFTREDVARADFPSQFIRYITLEVTSASPFELAELQLFGSGFAPQGSYLSKVVDLGEAANFGNIRWTVEGLRQDGDGVRVVPASEAGVAVTMRTGLDDNPSIYYEYTNLFTRERRVVSEKDYLALDPGVRGPIEDDQTDWSLWSAPFTSSGQSIDLPSPRRYFQFAVRFASLGISDGVRLGEVSVGYSIPPVAQTLIGEISRLDEPRPLGNVPSVTAGEISTFVYDIAADVAGTDTGFDGLRILAPSSQPVFRELSIGDPPIFVEPEEVASEVGRLTVLFPTHRIGAGTHRMRVTFDAEVFMQGTTIDAEVFDGASGDAPQRVLPGDANPEVMTNGLRVLTTAESTGNLLPHMEVRPSVLTPNGDGANDSSTISYSLVQLVRPVSVAVSVFDLSGRRVVSLFEGQRGSGAYAESWDGHAGGELLRPGIYLVRVEVWSDREQFVQTRTVGLAY